MSPYATCAGIDGTYTASAAANAAAAARRTRLFDAEPLYTHLALSVAEPMIGGAGTVTTDE